jgi:hypothetical protein
VAKKDEPEAPESALQQPLHNAVIEYTQKPRPVTLRWRGEGRHLLVVARSRNLRRRVVEKRRLRGGLARVGPLKPGAYYWGVYSISGQGKKQPLFELAAGRAVGA